MHYNSRADAERVAATVREENPQAIEVKVLEDDSVAMLQDLMFTRAICLGCTTWGWSLRFCFEDRERANREFAALKSEDDEPTGCVARRG